MFNIEIHSLLAFFIVIFFVYLLTPLAHRLGLVDKPGGRKIHSGNIPLIGGVAIFLGLSFTLLSLPISLRFYRSFIAGSALLIIVGILDDFHELSPRARLFAQFISGLLMTIWGGIYLENLGYMFGSTLVSLGLLGIPFTIFATVAMINAVNMTDGVDGLAGGLCFIELLFVSFFAYLGERFDVLLISSVLMSALLAFLYFNFPIYAGRQAKIFLGDSGSMLLGFTVTWLVVYLTQERLMSAVTILWILSIHIFDIITVTYRRLWRKQSPLMASQDHIHHLLLAFNIGPSFCNWLLYTASILMGLVGVLGYMAKVSELIMFLTFLLAFALYTLLVNCLWMIRSHKTEIV